MRLTDLELIRNSRYFDATWYSSKYTDIKNIDPCKHYLNHGGKEGRFPSTSFNGAKYLEIYPDVAQAHINPLVHFLRHGIIEKRWAGIEHAFRAPLPRSRVSKYQSKKDVQLLLNSPLFDADWYRLMYGHLIAPGVKPVTHYLLAGADAGLSPSKLFNGQAYSRNYPDIGKINPLVHYLRYGKSEGRAASFSMAQKKILTASIEHWSQIEPGLSTENLFHQQSENLWVNYSFPRNALSTAWRRIHETLKGHVEYVVAVPWLTRGGADLAAMNLLRALQEKHGKENVVLAITDHNRLDAIDWVPEGTRMVRFTEDNEQLLDEQRIKLVETLIWAFRPRQVFNVNSASFWNAYARSGRALSKMSSLRALLFCRDYTEDGRAVGYSDSHLRAALPHLDLMYFDTSTFMTDVTRQYGLPAQFTEKMVFLPQPFDMKLASTPPSPPKDRSRVLWVGRLCFQKNIELLKKIIEASPHIDFDIYGTGTPEKENDIKEFCLKVGHASFLGSFSRLEEIDRNHYGAFLFTSRYEGMPTILLNIAAIKLPIVASAVGGVPELIDDTTGWAIADIENPGPYVAALDQIAQEPEVVQRKAQALSHKLEHKHSWAAFKNALFPTP